MSSTYAMCARARAEICLCASTGGPRVVRVGLQLGYDDLELLNPLGVCRGEKKIGGFYGTIMNLPAEMRFRHQYMSPVCIVEEKVLKKYDPIRVVSGADPATGDVIPDDVGSLGAQLRALEKGVKKLVRSPSSNPLPPPPPPTPSPPPSTLSTTIAVTISTSVTIASAITAAALPFPPPPPSAFTAPSLALHRCHADQTRPSGRRSSCRSAYLTFRLTTWRRQSWCRRRNRRPPRTSARTAISTEMRRRQRGRSRFWQGRAPAMATHPSLQASYSLTGDCATWRQRSLAWSTRSASTTKRSGQSFCTARACVPIIRT